MCIIRFQRKNKSVRVMWEYHCILYQAGKIHNSRVPAAKADIMCKSRHEAVQAEPSCASSNGSALDGLLPSLPPNTKASSAGKKSPQTA